MTSENGDHPRWQPENAGKRRLLRLSSLPLTARMALVIGGFGLIGSGALVWWVLADEASVSRQHFVEEGRSNAAFMARSSLPASAQMARQLSEVLGMEVRFRRGDGSFIPPLTSGVPWARLPDKPAADGGIISADGWEALALPLRDGEEIWFSRPAATAWQGVMRPRAIAGLTAFWAVLLALAAGLARTVVRPVRALAGSLSGLSGDAPLSVPAVARRGDEIGALADALAATHTQLVSERRKRLESERMALLGRMAAGLAHEINNPAAAIRLHAQLLARSVAADSPARGSADTIASEADRISELVNQWLFLTRPAPPRADRVLLAPLLNEALTAAAPAADHAAVTLTLTTCPPGAAVTGDARRLRQILGNLLTNAIHASPESGTVRIQVTPSAAGDRWDIGCHDDGPGFSPRSLTHGTDLFFSEKEGGLGIGLSVSAEIAAAHGGSLTLSNPPGGGALVTLTLPCHHEFPP